MPSFKRIIVRARDGRGVGTVGMFQQVLDQYEEMRREFDAATESEQNAFIKALNEFEEDLGTDFAKSKEDFIASATSIMNMDNFMQFLKDLGFDVEMPQV